MADSNRRATGGSRLRTSSAEGAHAMRGRCVECKADVVFEELGAQQICPNCGLVIEEEQVFDDHATNQSERRKRPPTRAQHVAALRGATSTQRAVNRRDSVPQDAGEALRRRLQKKSYAQQIAGTLGVLGGYGHLTDDVNALILHSDALVSEQLGGGEGRGSTGQSSITFSDQLAVAIVAACYALVRQSRKNAPMTMSLEQLCEARMIGVERVKKMLARLEKVGAAVLQGGKTYDKPQDFIDAQIRFLNEQLMLPPRKRSKAATLTGETPKEGASLFNRHEQAWLVRAQPRSDSFSQLVHELATLCATHGMVNRTALKRNQLDLPACAWAMIMLVIEAQTGQECHEQVMSEAAAWALGRQSCGSIDGLSRIQLGLGTGAEQPGGVVEEEDNPIRTAPSAVVMAEARDRAIRATSITVRRRYQDIGRMLSMYIRALPWFDEKESGTAKKKRKASSQGEPLSSSVTLLPRKVIVQHLHETLRLHAQLKPKVVGQLQNGKLWGGEDGQLRDEDEAEEGYAQEVDTDASASQESGNAPPQPMFRWATFMLRSTGNRRRRVHEEVSSLAKSIGPTLLTLETLEQMDDATVDRLLFTQGELDTYVCTPDEVSLRRQTQDTTEDDQAGSRQEETEEEVMDDETIEAVIADALPVTTVAPQRRAARRTKARSQTEFRRILDELLEEASET